MLSVNIAPEADARRAGMRESEIHPAVFVEIESDDTDGGRKIFFFEVDRGERREFSFAGIQINRSAVEASSKNKIDGAIVIEIRSDKAGACSVEAETAFCGDVGERAIAIVAPEKIVGCCFARTGRAWAAL